MSSLLLSSAQLQRAIQISELIEKLEAELQTVIGGSVAEGARSSGVATPTAPAIGKRTMSLEARARIAAAQKIRWAKAKSGKSTKSPANSKQTITTSKASQKKTGLTAAGRARLAASMKARWAARKVGAPALNAPTKLTKGLKKTRKTVSPDARARMAAAAKKRWAKVRKSKA